MNDDKRPAAVLWTGGKDSALAMHHAAAQGLDIRRLVTFAPREGSFLAHPLSVMAMQAQAIGLPHQVVTIAEPYFESYRAGIAALAAEGITTLVTGDIAEVAGMPNWIRQCCEGIDVSVLTPLWGGDRRGLMLQLIDSGFVVIFSCVKRPWFTPDWLGRTIDRRVLSELEDISRATGLDICGENGEYHSLVLDGPMFRWRVAIDFEPSPPADLMHLRIRSASLAPKS